MARKSFAKIYSGRCHFPDEKIFHTKREYLASDMIDFEGKSISTTVYKVDSPVDRYKGLNATDFALENQLAVGVQLNPVKCSLSTSNDEVNQIKV